MGGVLSPKLAFAIKRKRAGLTIISLAGLRMVVNVLASIVNGFSELRKVVACQ